MKRTRLLFAPVLGVLLFATSCDDSFYLTEKEFYGLRLIVGTETLANSNLSSVRARLLRVTFNNSVSPPRVQSSNLQDYLRQGIPALAIYEGGNNHALRIDRISGEIEAQFDNWLSQQLRLYQGQNNAETRLERVEEMRVTFSTAPVFTYSPGRIEFTATAQVFVDCRIGIGGTDWYSTLRYLGMNGTYDTSIELNNVVLRGVIEIDSPGPRRDRNPANITFRLIPTVGAVFARPRTGSLPSPIASGIADVVRDSLRNPVEATLDQSYEYFSLRDCRSGDFFSCHYDQTPAGRTPDLHAVMRGTDNNLYSTDRYDDVWGDYRPLCCSGNGTPGRFTTDPVLAVSSARTVELAATTATGEIYHAQYRNGWTGEHSVIPPGGTSFQGRPALVATAPGQLELFAVRTDGKLLHVRRTNNIWWAGQLVDLPGYEGTSPNLTILAYRDPVAVQSGNKILLVAVSQTNRLYAKLYDLETRAWAQSTVIPTTEPPRFAPTLAASGDGRIDLVYVGTSGATYHRPISITATAITTGFATSGFALPSESQIPGSLTSTPSLVASGYRQLGLIGRGTNNLLYYNHFTGPDSPSGTIDGRAVVQGWSGWGDLNENFIGTQYWSGGTAEEFALSSTRSGKLDLLSRMPVGNGMYGTHYNSFDALDYGRQPWKTVVWRGSQRVGNLQMSGRPALAALDHNYAVAFVGANRNLYLTQLGSTITPLTGLSVLGGSTPVDPQMVSSGKGLVDVVVVGDDRKLRHVRFYNRQRSQTLTLPGQTNLLFQTRPTVVGFGEGQVEVVAASTTGSLHHWRMINGVWQNPVTINGTASSPVLVNTGSGQLELFAIGGDYKLYRWRFLAGGWTTWQQLPSSFTINPNKFGPGMAATPGDGAVDLVVVTNQAGVLVYHRYVEPRDDTVPGLGVPAQTFQNFGSQFGTQAFVGSIDRNKKFVIASDLTTTDFRIYVKNGTPGTPPNGWKEGRVNGWNSGLLIGGIAPLPDGSVAVATGINGRIWVANGLSESGSNGDFRPLPGQSSQSWLNLPRYQPAVASFAGP